MSAPILLNTATTVYIGKSGTPNGNYDQNSYSVDRELYEAVNRDFRTYGSKGKSHALIIWLVLANNAEGFIYKFSDGYFFKHWKYDSSAQTHGRKALIELGYLVPVEKKPYKYIFYADANGLLWKRNKNTQEEIDRRYEKKINDNTANRERWFAKVAERDRLKEEQKRLEQQNNGTQSDENKKADEE